MDRRLLEVGQVHRNLRQSPYQKPRSLDETHPAAGEAHRLGDFLGDLDIRRTEKHIVSNQKFAGANHCRPSCRVHSGFSEIGLARRIGGDIGSYTLKLSAPDVLQVLPFWRSGRRFVEVHRNLVALPYLLAHVPRHRYTVFDSHAINGDEWHHVCRAHPRMRALMLGQVDQLGRFAHTSNGGFLNRLPLSHQRNYAAIVVGIHLAIQQVNAIHLHGVNDRIDFRLVAAFGEIGNTLNQR